MRPKDAWLATQGQLELQLNRAAYDTWVRDCKFVGYQDNTYTISVRNAYVKDWLEQRLYRAIKHTLSEIYREPVEVVFVVSNPIQRTVTPNHMPLLSEPMATETAAPTTPNSFFSSWDLPYNYEEEWDSGLNTQYTFDNFVVGSSNQLAHAAAQAVVRAPGQVYNPLFIYGDVGLGKTHLLHAIGNACVGQDQKILYTTCEQFTNHLVESIRKKNTTTFREHYRHVDILLVDDIQFIAGKESTQEEFFHTFNALHGQGKQVVIAADRRPSEIKGLEKRLLSRLEWGLLVDIQAPSLETRLAIVHDKSERRGYPLANDVAHLIAQKASRNIRELEGVLTQILAHSALMGTPLTFEIAEQVLAEQRSNKRRQVPTQPEARNIYRLTLDQVLEGTAKVLQLSLKDLIGKRRTKDVVQARQWAIYLAREETQASWPEIGGAMGGRNHSTVLYSYNKVVEQIKADTQIRQRVNDIRQKIREVMV